MSEKKILFLDFDGVINSVRSAVAFGGFPWNIE
jgi:histidinol phosphatase-like enzyme